MRRNKTSHSLWLGVIILTIGTFWLLDRANVLDFPRYLFSWEIILIIVGLYSGFRRNFRGIGWLVMILVGGYFLLHDFHWFPDEIRHYAFPIAVIIFGLVLVLKAISHSSGKSDKSRTIFSSTETETSDDYFDISSVFGGSKWSVRSRQFKGGRALSIFGGTEIDMTGADISGVVTIDIFAMFGATKLIVPTDWNLESKASTILGGFEDKRTPSSEAIKTDKKVIITGTALLGGIEINGYSPSK